MDPVVTRRGVLDMQVCVPDNWIDQEVVDFANLDNPAGTENGWGIRHTGDPALAGCLERVPCSVHVGYVHIMLDC